MKPYKPVDELHVGLNLEGRDLQVGRLAFYDRRIYFEYDSTFISTNLQISPFHLPLESGVKTFDPAQFEGLPGVFNDSLPDGWGRLLFDRLLRKQNVLVEEVSPLDRLAYVGQKGMGALIYQPGFSEEESQEDIVLDQLAERMKIVLEGHADDVLEELFTLNGSSAGARPKAMVGLDSKFERMVHGTFDLPHGYIHWMVKFANSTDGLDSGAIEYVYSLMARNAGLDIPFTMLFPALNNSGYFATQRFDRNGNKRLHTHTACGLLHSDFRIPALDYEEVLTLTAVLTKDVREVEKAFRLAVFNVLAHNRDDHSKNISFLMNGTGEWKLAPCYDLTFSAGPNGEQSTTVMGEGRNPGIKELSKLGLAAKINPELIGSIIDQTQQALQQWPLLAKEYGVSKSNVDLIQGRIQGLH